MALRFAPGHRLTLLGSGAEFFPALIDAIDRAQRAVRIESYIFANDATARTVGSALAAAARRGVEVRVLVDGFGSPQFAVDWQPALDAAGAKTLVYRPERARLAFRRHRLRRLHRKLALIDERIAFVGGINILDDASDGMHGPRFDFAVRIEGPVVAEIAGAMRRLWQVAAWAAMKQRLRDGAGDPVPPAAAGEQRAAFVIRDSFRHRRAIERAYLAAITTARDSILIANAYFLPGRRFRRALLRAAQRGVEVRLLLQGCVEYRLQHYATQALYRRLLAGGIRIFEYRHGFLHAKVAVIDDRWATVGSSNIDPFSLLLAKEANLFIDDAAFAQRLRGALERAIGERSSALAADHWQRMRWPSRVLRWACYGLVRLAVSLAGYGHRR